MKASKLLPLLGIVAVGLVVVCFAVVGETPDTDASTAKIVAFYTSHDSDVSAGGVLLMAASALFLVWALQVRSLLFSSEGGSATRTTAGLVGAVIFAVGLAVFAGMNFALGDAPDKYTPATLQTLNVLSEDLFPLLAVGVFLALVGNGLAVLKTGALPRWLGWVAVVTGLGVFTPAWFVPFIGLGVFILVSSVLMAMRSEATAPTPQ